MHNQVVDCSSMKASRGHSGSGGFHKLYHQTLGDIESYCLPQFHILDNNACPGNVMQKDHLSFQTDSEQFFTLESSPAIVDSAYGSPFSGSVTSSRPFSPQGSQSCVSDPHQSPENTHGSPLSGSSTVDDGIEWKQRLKGSEASQIVQSCSCLGKSDTNSEIEWPLMAGMLPCLDLKKVLIACCKAVSEADSNTVVNLMDMLGQMVSVSGDPIQRLAAYLLEGLRARLESSGSIIYKALKCEQPTGPELLTYMHFLYQTCPYWKFAYTSANSIIMEVMKDEPAIHIIDFQIAQGSQWVFLIQALASRPRTPPKITITGVDDSQSVLARGGGLQIVGRNLQNAANSYGVPFEFRDVGMHGWEVEPKDLVVPHGEALAVNFPFVLHHMPDESVSTMNHRDRLLRLVRSLSPRIVTLVEQESNTNTAPFFLRFVETLDFYSAMFESIDAGCPRDDKRRISAEQHCVARDIVNIVACEGAERVERHELLGKWRLRFRMAGFAPCPLGPSVTRDVVDLLKGYHGNYRLEERNGALYLGWLNRALATSSAWKA